jgi:hypothetical protein
MGGRQNQTPMVFFTKAAGDLTTPAAFLFDLYGIFLNYSLFFLGGGKSG